jgi:hypothetical protein
MPGDIALSLTSEGRALARVRAARRIASDSRPSRTSPEGWLYVSTAARCFQPGDEKEMPERSEFALLDGRGLIARRDGFVYALSAICVPPIHGNFRLDPQNAIELYHAKAGWLLHGCNSQEQPEAGSFFRKLDDRAVFLPVEGGVQRTLAGHAARLKFETFEAQVVAAAASRTEFEVRAELLKKTGGAPVVYSFFPGLGFDRQRGAPDEITLSEDRRTLRFRNVVIECSRPVELERDFVIFNPYSAQRGTRTKPVRAFCEVDLGKPLMLRITVAK